MAKLAWNFLKATPFRLSPDLAHFGWFDSLCCTKISTDNSLAEVVWPFQSVVPCWGDGSGQRRGLSSLCNRLGGRAPAGFRQLLRTCAQKRCPLSTHSQQLVPDLFELVSRSETGLSGGPKTQGRVEYKLVLLSVSVVCPSKEELSVFVCQSHTKTPHALLHLHNSRSSCPTTQFYRN